MSEIQRPDLCWGQYYARWENCPSVDLTDEKQRILGRMCCDECIPAIALKDELTGLPNRRQMAAVFEDLKSSGDPFGVLAIDLENYKCVNDRLGHQKGDEILKETAVFFQKSTRLSDTAIARRGGDEFALLLRLLDKNKNPVKDKGRALRTAGDRLKNKYQGFEPVRAYNSALNLFQKRKKLGIRYGYEAWDNKMSLEELLERADPKGRAVRRAGFIARLGSETS